MKHSLRGPANVSANDTHPNCFVHDGIIVLQKKTSWLPACTHTSFNLPSIYQKIFLSHTLFSNGNHNSVSLYILWAKGKLLFARWHGKDGSGDTVRRPLPSQVERVKKKKKSVIQITAIALGSFNPSTYLGRLRCAIMAHYAWNIWYFRVLGEYRAEGECGYSNISIQVTRWERTEIKF